MFDCCDLKSFFRRGVAGAPHGGAVAGGAAKVMKGGEDSPKLIPRVSEFRSNQVYSVLNKIHPFSSHNNAYMSQMRFMSPMSTRFYTAATSSAASPAASHARPLSPHLSIYKPQSNSMFSISNRIAASFLSGVALLFYFLYMKTGLICFTYNSFYQLFFGVSGFTELICYSSVPLVLLHLLHSVKH